jgi:uncharacterized membrane protein
MQLIRPAPVIQGLLLGAMCGLSAAAWSHVPNRLAVHWNLAGDADRYGGKWEGLLGLPLIALGLALLRAFLPRLDPGRANYASYGAASTVIRIAMVAMLAGIHSLVVAVALGREPRISLVVPVLTGCLLIVLGSVMGKIRPNWFVGLRTPWTLSSKRSWTRTHRLGGWLFVLVGTTFVISGFAGSDVAHLVPILLSVTGVVTMVVYSYLEWRHDPDRRSPIGTMPAEER